MSKKNKDSISDDYIKALYNDTELVIQNQSPYYVISKESVQLFLHECKRTISLNDRFFTILGLEISLIITLFTTTFRDIGVVKGDCIKGIYVAFILLFGAYILHMLFVIGVKRKMLTIEALCKDFETRSSIMKPKGICNDVTKACEQQEDRQIVIS